MSERKCNRTACGVTTSCEWYWNHVTRAWYCWDCAERINRSPMNTLPGKICIHELELPPTTFRGGESIAKVMKLRRAERIVTAVMDLYHRGYDGPMMGEDVRELMTACIEYEKDKTFRGGGDQ